jgi:glycosyltransferase involved in cell wall biosynthesis
MFLVTHPVGNQNVRELIKTLDQRDELFSFLTSISYDDNSLLGSYLPAPLKKELERRAFSGVKQSHITSFPVFDSCRLLAQKIGFSFLVKSESGILRPENLYEYFDRKSASFLKKNQCHISSVYGYDAKCINTFKVAKEIGGIKLFYEAAFGYTPFVAELLSEQNEITPDWKSSTPVISQRSIDKQIEEVELADHIIVASHFARKSFEKNGVNKKLSVIPYGSPPVLVTKVESEFKTKKASLNIVYIGALTQQKGISYLFEALSKISPDKFKLTLVGKDYSMGVNKALRKELNKHNWIETAPHNKVLDILSSADVLILPSIAEAFGLVVLEAMSRGTTVIVSKNCGAADVVQNGVNGFVVPIRDSDTIASKLELLYADNSLLNELKDNALTSANQRCWNKYSQNITVALGV